MAVYEEFKDKVVLITGGAGGIGTATAEKMGINGCKVFIGDINQKAINQVVSNLKDKGIRAAGMVVDVTSEESVKTMVDTCNQTFGPVDYLVAAAGIYKDYIFKDMTFEQWKQTIDINLNGVFLVTRAVIPTMIKRHYGAIIVFCSQASIRGSAKHTQYGASKAGLQGLVKCLMYEVSTEGVRINAVAPGVIATPMTMGGSEEKLARWIQSIPMRRFGEPMEAANVIAFLCSDDASYVTGQTIPINGGSTVNT